MPAVDRTRRAPAWAGPGATQHMQRLSGARLWWVERGSGTPLVLLHGYAGTARWWVRNLAALSSTRHVYALDLPGFGRSRLAVPFTLAGCADLLARWMQIRDLPPVDAVAHSMGGQVAVLLAARHPERVRSLVLAAPAGVPLSTGLPGLALRALRSRARGDPRFTLIVAAGGLRSGPRVLWQAIQQIRTVQVAPLLPAIAAPALIIWGDRDVLLPHANAATFAAALSGTRLRSVPGGGHNLMFEQPEIFNAAVDEFLNGLPA